jgi:hypothetical protein
LEFLELTMEASLSLVKLVRTDGPKGCGYEEVRHNKRGDEQDDPA